MSLSPAIIDAMLAAGCTAEQLAAVVKADMADRESQTAAKRQKDAERQRKHRERNAVSRDVTVTECDRVTDPLSRPPNENNSNPPTHTPEKQTPARKGHRLPVDWQPGPLTGDAAQAVAGWPPGAEERELARFRDWAASATGANAVKSDWQAAWRNWIRKAEDDGRYGKQNGRNSQPPRPAIMDIGRSVAADLEREAAARAGY